MGSYECLLQPSMLSIFSYLEIDMDRKLSRSGVQVARLSYSDQCSAQMLRKKSDINLFEHYIAK